jgi:ribonuclease HI
MTPVVIHSDGACHGNPGPGAWAAVLTSGSHRREVSGAVSATTNNRMELQAAIEAFAALKRPCAVEFHTDSNYLRDGITQWLPGWQRNGWRTKSKQPVKNADLWRQLAEAVAQHQVNWHWVKGHAGDAAMNWPPPPSGNSSNAARGNRSRRTWRHSKPTRKRPRQAAFYHCADR